MSNESDFKKRLTRRRFLQGAVAGAAGLTGVAAGMRSVVWAAGSDAPEKPEAKIGFHPANRLRERGDLCYRAR